MSMKTIFKIDTFVPRLPAKAKFAHNLGLFLALLV